MVLARAGPSHDPAAFVFAFGLVGEHTFFFQLGKGRVPEMQVEDFAFAGEEVVFDVEAVHGLEMASEHGGRDQVGDGRSFAARVFNRVQRLQTGLQVLLVLLVPLRDAGVEVPAVVIKARLA